MTTTPHQSDLTRAIESALKLSQNRDLYSPGLTVDRESIVRAMRAGRAGVDVWEKLNESTREAARRELGRMADGVLAMMATERPASAGVGACEAERNRVCAERDEQRARAEQAEMAVLVTVKERDQSRADLAAMQRRAEVAERVATEHARITNEVYGKEFKALHAAVEKAGGRLSNSEHTMEAAARLLSGPRRAGARLSSMLGLAGDVNIGMQELRELQREWDGEPEDHALIDQAKRAWVKLLALILDKPESVADATYGDAMPAKAQPKADGAVACSHPQGRRHGSADTMGRITEYCGACGVTLVDIKVPAPQEAQDVCGFCGVQDCANTCPQSKGE
jgi:hypothetical protein